MKNKNLCIIQARTGSTRLPGKIFKKVNNITMLEYEIRRLKLAKKIHKIIVATSDQKRDDKVELLCKKNRFAYFRGSEKDALDRYYQCSKQYLNYNNIIRICGDCPLIDPMIVDNVIEFFENNKLDYTSNVIKETFPDGMAVEIFTQKVLERVHKNAKTDFEKEHVTTYIRKSEKFRKANFVGEIDWSHFRLVLDYKEDFEVIKFLIKNSRLTDGYLHYISLLTQNIHIMFKNIKHRKH